MQTTATSLSVILAAATCVLFASPLPAMAQRQRAVTADTLRGVPWIVNLAESPDEVSELRLRELWRVGGLDASEEQAFAGPFMATVLDRRGQAWILDQASARLTLFDSSGRYVRTVAGPGRGPGELSFPTGLSSGPSGEVWVSGVADGYYKVFDLDGRLIRTMRQSPHAVNRLMAPFVVTFNSVVSHADGYPTIKFFRADSLAAPIDSFRLRVPDIGIAGGILRRGTPAYRTAALRPGIRWTFSRDGSSIWLARSDSLGLTQMSVRGDTLRRVEARHRVPSLTDEQRSDIRQVRRQNRNAGPFVPMLIQAMFGLEDGRVLVQVGSDMFQPGAELDVYSAEGILEGVIRPSLPINHRAELSSRGDTILYVGVDEYDVPVVVKAVLERGGG